MRTNASLVSDMMDSGEEYDSTEEYDEQKQPKRIAARSTRQDVVSNSNSKPHENNSLKEEVPISQKHGICLSFFC